MMRHSTLYPALVAVIVGAFSWAGCGGCEGRKASVQGRVASAEGFGQASSALEQEQRKKSGLGQQSQALTVEEGISVGLFRRIPDVDELNNLIDAGAERASDMGDGHWIFVDSREPEPDGSFSFPNLAPGHYSLQLEQPEFGGAAYGADGTDFHLEPGQTISLILPLVSTIEVDAPGLLTGSREPFVDGVNDYRSADGAIMDEESGLIIGGGGGLWTLDPDNEALNSLFSATLFGSRPDRDLQVVAYAPARNEAFVVFANRVVAVDLTVFDDVEPGRALEYDDPQVRLDIGDKVRWRFIDPAMTEHMSALRWGPSHSLRWFFSADESLLYVTVSHGTHGFAHRVMVLETDTLSVRRMLFGEVIAYNAHVDQLVLRTADGLVLVDASAMRDVADVEVESDLGVAPVPDSGEYYVAYTKLAADDRRVPFIALVDDEGGIVSDQRASELFGMAYDPDPGTPWFDSTGEYFMLGTQGFRLLEDGGFEFLGLSVPLGQLFENRVGCNAQRVFDPVNRYEIWFDSGGCPDLPSAMAIISTDRGNIPISIRVNSANVLLHPPSGRAFVLDDNNNISVVHYADPNAVGRPAFTRLVTGEEHLGRGQECSADEPCPFEEVCVGRTDTAWTGHCMENLRNPFLIYCGGLTGIECDDGYTCDLFNPTNPDSLGFCRGCPERDYENHGPRCNPDGECIAGFSCNDSGRCVPQACMSEEDCEDGEVCGMVRNVGRVCVTPGPLETGEICHGPEECHSGVCIDTVNGSDEFRFMDYDSSGPFQLCTTPCVRGADCPEGSQCAHIETPWPVCIHEEWVLSGYGDKPTCSPACDEDAICSERWGASHCQVGFVPGVFECTEHMAVRLTVECSSNDECALPASCVPFDQEEGVCGVPCSRNDDCPWDAECINGVCNVTSQFNEDAYRCEGGAGCPDHLWCLDVWFYFLSEQHFCVDEDACYSDSDCPGDLECMGICTRSCPAPASADVCPGGFQCVSDSEAPEGLCLPPVCDCPDAGGVNTVCHADTGRCLFPQTCAPASCDGTYGPLVDPADPEAGTCCQDDNPCGLEREEICQCPPSCDFWLADHCCHGEDCPAAGQELPSCPEGYSSLLGENQAYGFFCGT